MDNKNFSNTDEEATFVASNPNPIQTTLTETPGPPQGSQSGPPPDYFTDDLPPAYQVASALPTYEESELTKGMILKKELLYTIAFTLSEKGECYDYKYHNLNPSPGGYILKIKLRPNFSNMHRH